MADHPITIVYDYDDTLVGYRRFGEKGKMLAGAAESLRRWLDAGYAVAVASCRVNWKAGEQEIFDTLTAAGFDPTFYTEKVQLAAGKLGIYVGQGKPLGYVYVDDRGLEFNGDHEYVNEILHERLPPP